MPWFLMQRCLRIAALAPIVGGAMLVAGCGGSSSGNAGGSSTSGPGPSSAAAAVDSGVPDQPTTKQDAVRFLDQAGFGPTEALVAETMRRGPRKQLLMELAEPASRYTYTLPENAWRNRIHTDGNPEFCAQFTDGTSERDNCWRDWYSSLPVVWDFFRQAATNRDQLRQRVAFALSQIFVVSGVEIDGSYGFAEYQQMLRDNAFGNLRTLLQKVTLSPMMGRYLNMVDNDGADPNENYGRELLQLFTVGTCLLNADGSLVTGKCQPTYDNTVVRAYAYALSGWTYPAGGVNAWCNSCKGWKNPTYLRGDMVAVASRHDSNERALLSGVKAPSGRTPQQGLSAVLDSIMAHPNVGPFLGKQLIQHLVTSNPSPAYVARVSAAFNSGLSNGIGTGARGDLSATLAAILLDDDARDPARAAAVTYGRLKDPVQYILGAIRALNGVTDGEYFGQWGPAADMGQPVFNAPSVFNFYPPDFPLPGSPLVAPQFGIYNANTALARINFANDLVYWWYNRNQGLAANATIAGATGTRVNYEAWEGALVDPSKDSDVVVERLNQLLTAGRLGPADKQAIVTAMNTWTPTDTWLTNADTQSNWKRERVKTAAYLILSSPHFQVQQ